MRGDDKAVRQNWSGSNSGAYYKEAEQFREAHEKADFIEIDESNDCMVKAVYYFKPWQVYKEKLDLLRALGESEDHP